MADPTFRDFRRVYADLRQEGDYFVRPCPQRHCGGTLRIRDLGQEPAEWSCTECGGPDLRDAVRADFHARATGATNGVLPASCPSEQHPSVASVAYFPESRGPKATPLVLPKEALYGLSGDVVTTIEPHTESHPAAVLGSFLAGAGCLVGRGPYVYRDGARHGCNEFIALVGPSSAGRKGTGTRRAHEIFTAALSSTNISEYDMIDHVHDRSLSGLAWSEVLFGGLGSGEALIEALAVANAAGEFYPRRLIVEEEFSKPLKVMRREGSILSETLRHAWDGALLANRTKGKSLVATTSHVGVLVHTTDRELQDNLSPTEAQNGFANRFLWLRTDRVKSLPFGGGEVPLAPLVKRLHDALEFARPLGAVEFDAAAARIWGDGGVYDLLVDRPAGLLGAITARAASHVTRLALLYAVLDLARQIRVCHLLAALAVWDYSERSAVEIFGQSTGDDYADLILEYLWEARPGCLTRVELRDRFKRHAEPGRIPKALALLESLGAVSRHRIPGEGRYAEAWIAENRKICDGSDGSPLQRAKSLATEATEATEATDAT